MRESLKNIFAGIGMATVIAVAGLTVVNFAQPTSVAAENEFFETEYQPDIDPQLIHYRTQYFQLLNDYDMLREENDLLKMQIKYNEDIIASSEPNYDLDGDGIVTICDAVKLMKFLVEMED